jgi:hypothetical protein
MGAVLSYELAGESGGSAPRPAALPAEVQALIAHPDAVVHPALRLALPPPVLARSARRSTPSTRSSQGWDCLPRALASAFLVPSGRAQDLALEENRAAGSPS